MTATKTSLETAPATRTQWLITLYAGGGEFWKLNVRTGQAAPDLGGEK